MPVQSATGERNWSIEQLALDWDRLDSDATTFALANGFLGIRGAIDELPDQHASFLPDAFVRRPIRYHESFPGFATSTDTRLAGPGVTLIRILLDDDAMDFTSAQVLAFQRTLDLAGGALRRRTHWRLQDGRELLITAERIVPVGYDAVCASRISVQAVNFAATVTVECPVVAPVAGYGTTDPDDPRINARTAMTAATQSASALGRMAVFVPSEGGRPSVTVVQKLATTAGDVNGDLSLSAALSAGMAITFDRFVALGVGEPDCAPVSVFSALNVAAKAGFDELRAGQANGVAAFNHGSALTVGEERMDRALKFNLFHLFQSASRDPRFGVAAKGLTGEGYEGHYFWDTEVFVAPVLALLQPESCRNLILYRCGKLDDARANARAVGHARGALFPWRTIAGRECSAHYPTGAAQYHVNAAIAYAVEQYEHATGDVALVDDHAAEALFETARLWFDLGHFSDRRGGAFLIHGVTGPDEYTALVDNDFYTNAMARRHLRYAIATAQRMARDNAQRFAELSASIGLAEAEIADWERAATMMWLPVDARTGVHPQDDTFLDKPRYKADVHDAAHGPMLLRVHPMVLFRHQLCKQGDVIQAHCVSGGPVARAQLERDLAYYEPLTTHDSTLSSAAFATIAARIGRDDKALSYHRAGALVDLEDRHGNTAHGAHMAAMAGSWLTLAQGWAGLDTDGGVLRFAPRCPPAWPQYSFRLRWRGSLIEIEITADATRYRLIEGRPVALLDHGRKVMLDADEVAIGQPSLKGVIFDLDGVLTDTAEAHFQAWDRLAREEGISFDRHANEALKGVDRAGSLRLILENASQRVSDAEFAEMLARKNRYYRESLSALGPGDLLPGARTLIEECLRAGMRVGLASASRNAPDIIERLGIGAMFDHITDPGAVANGKPAPDIFIATAQALGLEPHACVGIEDAAAGIAAIRAAGMAAIGIGDSTILAGADLVVPSIAALTVDGLHSLAATYVATPRNTHGQGGEKK